jgi:5-methylcytosine-specific restriction endonuclease McrA
LGQSEGGSAGEDREERATVASPARVDSLIMQGLERDVQRVEPERYSVQFTATEEYVRLVEEAKALLSHAVPNVRLEELQMRAMRALVAELKKKKYAAVESSPARARDAEAADALPPAGSRTGREGTDALEQHGEPTDALEQATEQPHTRRRGRHIPATVRRTVFEREGNRCSYLDANGARCPETHRLEFHHLKPFAVGGEHRASNLTLRCAAHNALAAEEDFGRELIKHRKNSRQHEALGSFTG